MSSRGWFRGIALAAGLLFLYLPILLMIGASFNFSRLVTVWDPVHSPTLKWYAELMHDYKIINAALLSVRIALLTACAAAVLGTVSGYALARFGPFRSRALLSALITAPLVMPEVITGLAMLILFVTLEQWIGWPRGRGLITISLAHITFAMSYVTLIVQSRLAGFDASLEEAALDLGARPLKVFFRITLPLISPAIVSGWLLAFTLSWDDVVISQFVSGPGSTTLPVVVFSRVRLGVSPTVNALATIMVSIVALGVVLAATVMHHRERRRAWESQMAVDP